MTIIEKMDGSRYDMTSYGFPVLKIGPVDIVYDSENVLGRPGRNRTSRYHGVRKIQLKMLLNAKSESHAVLLEEQLAEIFDFAEDFYIYRQVSRPYEFELPGQTSFTSSKDALEWTPHLYKRWKVERINNDAIEWDGTKGKRVIEFETSDLPYGETPFTSLELADSSKEWGNDMLAWGLGFDWVNDLPEYSFASNNFTVKNIGNIKIDPRHMPLKIELKGTFANYVQIENQTTGDTFRLNTALSAGQTLVLNGVDYLRNGLSVTKDTNKKLITLAKGENQFVVTGGLVSSFTIETPFYFIQ